MHSNWLDFRCFAKLNLASWQFAKPVFGRSFTAQCNVRQSTPNPKLSIKCIFCTEQPPYRSARHARRSVRDIIEGQGHRDAGVMPHQRDDISDSDVPERLDGAVMARAAPTARWTAPS